jgi:hypothetical protein
MFAVGGTTSTGVLAALVPLLMELFQQGQLGTNQRKDDEKNNKSAAKN